MEAISFIILILLCLVGYCLGAAWKAGKSKELKPQIIDLILILIIWGGAIYYRIVSDLNKWLMILIGVIISSIVGIFAIWPRRLPQESLLKSSPPREKKGSKNLVTKIWQSWKNFSLRAGAFQSRIILSLFYFIFVTPFAVVVRVSSDPLRIKAKSKSKPRWFPKKELSHDSDRFKRQF